MIVAVHYSIFIELYISTSDVNDFLERYLQHSAYKCFKTITRSARLHVSKRFLRFKSESAVFGFGYKLYSLLMQCNETVWQNYFTSPRRLKTVQKFGPLSFQADDSYDNLYIADSCEVDNLRR